MMKGKWKYAAVILAAVLIITGTAFGVKGRHIEPAEEQNETAQTEAALFEVYDIADMQHIGNVEAQEPEEETEKTAPILVTEQSPSEDAAAAEIEAPVQEMEAQLPAPACLMAFFENKLCIDPEKVSLYLNVRAEPNEDSTILTVLYPDDIVPFVSCADNWYEVQLDGFTGFVNAFYVLAGQDAYEEMKDTVAYAVMVKEDGISMYENPEETGTVILYANKGDVFRAVDMDASYYTVSVRSPIYETLVIPKNKVVLYYLFLGPGNNNELTDEAEEMFGKLDIESNLARTEMIQREVVAEEMQASIDASIMESSIAQASWEAAYYASVAMDTTAETWATWAQETPAPTQTWQEWQPVATEAPTAAPTVPPTEPPTTAPATDPPVEASSGSGSNLTYLGTFRITHYCHCTKCCGVWGSDDPNYPAHGASGLPLVSDYSVAVYVPQIPYGTRLLINGREYVAADCGVGANCIDIYRRTHAEASAGGMYYADVYIIN